METCSLPSKLKTLIIDENTSSTIQLPLEEKEMKREALKELKAALPNIQRLRF